MGPTPVKSKSALFALTRLASQLTLGAWLVERQARTWRDRGLAELMTRSEEMFGRLISGGAPIPRRKRPTAKDVGGPGETWSATLTPICFGHR